MLFILFNHFNIYMVTSHLHICHINSNYCIFLSGTTLKLAKKSSKHISGLPHVCLSLYLIIIQFGGYIQWRLCCLFILERDIFLTQSSVISKAIQQFVNMTWTHVNNIHLLLKYLCYCKIIFYLRNLFILF